MQLEQDAVAWIVRQLARLRADHGAVLDDPELVEPNGDFFPDEFGVHPEGIGRLVQRMATYAPLSQELRIDLAFSESESSTSEGGGCGSGACGTGEDKQLATHPGAVETEDGYAVVLDIGQVTEPALLTAAVARALGRIIRFEAGSTTNDREAGALAEVTAVASGFGLLLLNGSSVYKKACSGMRKHRGTVLGTEELALALALFLRTTGKKATSVRRYLAPTQREAFDAALAWTDTQPRLIRTMQDHPELLVEGLFTPEAPKSFFSKLFSRAPLASERDFTPSTPLVPRKTPRTEDELRRLAEAKALVDEALQDG